MTEKSTMFFENMHIDEYHSSDEFISQSRLQKLKVSPFHFKNPEPYQKKEYFDFGDSMHMALLEPDRFKTDVCTFDPSLRPEPTKDFRNAKNKEYRNDFHAKNEGKTILDIEVYDAIKEIASRIFADDFISELLGHGLAESSFFWTDEETGVKCKTRWDWARYNGVVLDVKTSQSANPDDFQRSIAKYGYHIQAGSQCIGYEKHFQVPVKHYLYLVIENKPPYSYVIMNLPTEAIELGQFEYKQLLQKLSDCRLNDKWPGFEERSSNAMGIVECGLPAYYQPYTK